jgi:excisionase family DNA binding protein
MTPKFLSPKEAASELGCHVDFIRSEIRRRRMTPVHRVNQRVIRIPMATFEAYRRSRVA